LAKIKFLGEIFRNQIMSHFDALDPDKPFGMFLDVRSVYINYL